jgi:hypothetical protein
LSIILRLVTSPFMKSGPPTRVMHATRLAHRPCARQSHLAEHSTDSTATPGGFCRRTNTRYFLPSCRIMCGQSCKSASEPRMPRGEILNLTWANVARSRYPARRGHARQIGSFEKTWRRACVKIGPGKWMPIMDPVTKEPVLEPSRYPGSRPKQPMKYKGLIFHDLRRAFVTDADHAGAPRHEKWQ